MLSGSGVQSGASIVGEEHDDLDKVNDNGILHPGPLEPLKRPSAAHRSCMLGIHVHQRGLITKPSFPPVRATNIRG